MNIRSKLHCGFKRFTVATVGTLLFSVAAQGNIYTGSVIDFSGGATLNTSLGSASGFLGFCGPNGTGSPVVLGDTQTGVYADVPAGTPVTFTPFIFNPATANTLLWSFTYGGTDYSFTITSETTYFQNSNFLNLAGEGLANIGSTAMPATWSITATDTGTSSVTFGAAIAAVPEPSSMGFALLGSIACIPLLVRRRPVA